MAGRKLSTSRARHDPAGTAAAATIVMGVSISSPEKTLWPDAGDGRPVTKLDLASYFAAAGTWMLRHIEGRPCSIVRAPAGIGGHKFFQRHVSRGSSNLLESLRLPGQQRPYLAVNRVESLAALAQLAALELHPGNGVPHRPEVPGRLVFDLDPAPDVPFDAVTTAAVELRERLAHCGLVSFCKTTGGKGLHVVAPLAHGSSGRPDWELARSFTQAVCHQMAADSPRRYLLEMSRRARAGRILLDYLRNDALATAVAPLSPRARPGATVSMPLEWSQVRAGLDPRRFTVRNACTLLTRHRPWADYGRSGRSLQGAMRRLAGRRAR